MADESSEIVPPGAPLLLVASHCALLPKPAGGVPLSYRVADKMRLSKDRKSLKVNDSLTLAGIPAEAFEYRLGNRSALEWVVDQYQVSKDKKSGIVSDPNRADDREYIVRLVGEVIRVSLETVRIVKALPRRYGSLLGCSGDGIGGGL